MFEVFFDGECPLCLREINRSRGRQGGYGHLSLPKQKIALVAPRCGYPARSCHRQVRVHLQVPRVSNPGVLRTLEVLVAWAQQLQVLQQESSTGHHWSSWS